MDYLDRLIQLAQVEGKINVLCRFQGSWQLKHQQEPEALGIFHIISKGECRLTLNDQQSYHLKPGDVFFLPHGLAHRIDSKHQSAVATEENTPLTALQQLQHGPFTLRTNNQASHDFEMFCGYFHYSGHSTLPAILPEYWYLSGNNSSVAALLELLQKEALLEIGTVSVVNALCNVLFTYLTRDYIQRSQDVTNGVLGALQDKRLYHSVNAMLQNPENSWNMENLAELSTMSRANFIRLFKSKTGTLPGKFLTGLRMQKAELLLCNTNKSILAVALEVGYQSEAHFSKAFKLKYGISPSKYRVQRIEK
ncbi:AraC family transcriptional regulator [Testudinibacter sp. TR-2022]|uniref:cupin domain-containing protein n=1 Tax=Testudinibacter sp. TR-2022 TaxID=2585029 RepID=UPI00111A1F21|nr:cupin domain-containing protein [Testudinibacter sp. TR-2022]TNG93089.1 AraC family transcriptional regulator [Pasteurellaceae bacterium USgator41]TNG95780.1 AraC family transcriptional regulator [Pasteurellaceae bacterium UScroc12]TNG98446.1 AraC family transcriptional regulator [Pasteurellaceae bacterium USgator11]TNH00916.1 AraC family transcriptional regulator [Pasteurellaceae bacterium UScroc31]TNH03628.1 AraC family transcriptional regulator [Pasteurellaceae bacterium Phil31]TNH08019